MARRRPPGAETRRLTKEELTRLGFSPGSKRHVAADIKRVTKRTSTWSERQAVQVRKGMTKEAYTRGVQRGEFAYSEKTAKHQRHVEYGRRISKHVPEMTAKDRFRLLQRTEEQRWGWLSQGRSQLRQRRRAGKY